MPKLFYLCIEVFRGLSCPLFDARCSSYQLHIDFLSKIRSLFGILVLVFGFVDLLGLGLTVQ